MITNDLRAINRIALTILGWLLGIFLTVYWRSGGNMLAVSLATGLMLGVMIFWGFLHINVATHKDTRSGSSISPSASTHPKMRRPSVEPQYRDRSPLANTGFGSPRSPSMASDAAVHRRPSMPFPMTNMPDTNAIKSSPYIEDTGVCQESPLMISLDMETTAPGFDFLDEMNYLYKPSAGRNRQTLRSAEQVRDSARSEEPIDNRKIDDNTQIVTLDLKN